MHLHESLAHVAAAGGDVPAMLREVLDERSTERIRRGGRLRGARLRDGIAGERRREMALLDRPRLREDEARREALLQLPRVEWPVMHQERAPDLRREAHRAGPLLRDRAQEIRDDEAD